MADARRVAENLDLVRARIAAAAMRSGRSPNTVRLVAVTKYAELATIRAAVEAGCHDLGESRPQQLWQRAAALADLPVRWHLIGHLQRNKTTRTAEVVSLVHSCDSIRLAHALNDSATTRPDKVLPVLIEVNIAEDSAKHGFAPGELLTALPTLAQMQHLEVAGLMAMAGRPDDPVAARADFRRLRQLRDQLRNESDTGLALNELSMGMSGDYEIAIEEGATIVRVGSALFEGAEG